MKKFHATVTIICVIFLSSSILVPLANADWSMFRADPSHDGVGTGNPAITPTLLWKYTTGNGIVSSPAVVGGVVCIGAKDENVYALDASNGAQRWNYHTFASVSSSPAVVGG